MLARARFVRRRPAAKGALSHPAPGERDRFFPQIQDRPAGVETAQGAINFPGLHGDDPVPADVDRRRRPGRRGGAPDHQRGHARLTRPVPGRRQPHFPQRSRTVVASPQNIAINDHAQRFGIEGHAHQVRLAVAVEFAGDIGRFRGVHPQGNLRRAKVHAHRGRLALAKEAEFERESFAGGWSQHGPHGHPTPREIGCRQREASGLAGQPRHLTARPLPQRLDRPARDAQFVGPRRAHSQFLGGEFQGPDRKGVAADQAQHPADIAGGRRPGKSDGPHPLQKADRLLAGVGDKAKSAGVPGQFPDHGRAIASHRLVPPQRRDEGRRNQRQNQEKSDHDFDCTPIPEPNRPGTCRLIGRELYF